MAELVRLAIDQSIPKSVVVQEVAIALLNGLRLDAPRDEDLGVGLSVCPRVNETTMDTEYVCVQVPSGRLLPSYEVHYVTDFRGHRPVGRDVSCEDRSAFGAAFAFVEFVGCGRARDAIRNARAK